MKVICPGCGKLIDINSKTEKVYCNECGNTFTQDQGLEILNKKYKLFQDKAYKACYHENDYKTAREYYKESLAIKPNDFCSIVELILCDLYAQKFDAPAFNKIIPTLDSYDVYLNHENTFVYLSFLRDVIKQVEVFNEEGLTRLRNENGEFLNLNYLNYYLNGMKDALITLKELQTYIPLCSEEEKKEFIENDFDVVSKLQTTINFLEEHINKEYKVSEMVSEIESLDVVSFDENNEKRMKFIYVAGGIIIALLIICVILVATIGEMTNYLIALTFILPFGLYAAAKYYYSKNFEKREK